ncbi:hypothetical protein AAKU64_003076 [Undibacterium sp. GrIS 1.8]|uniref:DUF7716 domain-containing protein n=1 Tax=unclassified Undibacterium TaxID=2630295 RepID=UPI003396F982
MNHTISIKDILTNPENFDGWLYLPTGDLALGTNCFVLKQNLDADPDWNEQLKHQLIVQGWKPIIPNEEVEDVIENTKAQIDNPTLEQLFKAFVFYCENDAFMEWDNE